MKDKMKTVINDIVPIFVFLGVIIAIFLNGWLLSIKSSSDCILLITFFGLVWYSYETRRARISSEKQTELSLTPFVVLKLEENEAAGYCFKLKNVGAGLALYIKITENNIVCRNSIYSLNDTEKVKVPEFEIPYFLYPGQEEILKPRQKGEKDIWIIKGAGTIKITYKNLKGEEFSGRFEIKERCKDEKNWTYWKVQPKD